MRWLLGSLAGLIALSSGLSQAANESRRFAFSYDVVVPGIEAGTGPVDVFLPLPIEDEQQSVVEYVVSGTIPGTVEHETVYANRFFHARVEHASGRPIELSVRAVIDRRLERRVPPASAPPLSDEEREALALFLRANDRVVVGHEVLDPILAEVREAAVGDDVAAKARAIYDWVVDNVEYKKVGTGWGNGDTFWACSERYGNCTDFHSLLISLARTEGIPARFEMGFPIPLDADSGEIAGYHCWVELYLPGTGWLPVDASEASKHREQRDLFYGTHPADRLHMTTGRDLRLGSSHRGGALNYFVYPYVEVDGKPYVGEIERRFRFEELAPQ